MSNSCESEVRTELLVNIDKVQLETQASETNADAKPWSTQRLHWIPPAIIKLS